MAKYSVGIQCKACGRPLTSKNIDTELCNECMEVVIDYNSDLLEKMSIEEFEKSLCEK